MKAGLDYVGVTIGAFVHDGKGNVMLLKRSVNTRDEHGTWSCPGGGMKHGETFEETCQRELEEEIGCHASEITFCGVTNLLREHMGHKTHWVLMTYAAKVDPKEARNACPLEVDEIGWFPVDKLPTPLHSMYLPQLHLVKKAGVL